MRLDNGSGMIDADSLGNSQTCPMPLLHNQRPLCIVKTGDTFADIRACNGDFEDWIVDSDTAKKCPVMIWDPRTGSAGPPAESITGAIITGSHAMVTDRQLWMEKTAAWIRQLVEAQTPLLGICFGHQLLAHALGGVVGDHPNGPETGTVTIRLEPTAADDPLFKKSPLEFFGQASHQQTVLSLPQNAILLARNDFEKHHAFRIGRCAWGIQFHPEFTPDVMRSYIRHQDSVSAHAVNDWLEAVRATPEAHALLRRFTQICGLR